MATQRSVFFVSDHTGITAETLGRGLLSQFDHIEFRRSTLPFVDTPEKAQLAVKKINEAAAAEGMRPLAISSITDPGIRAQIAAANALVIDVFDTFIPMLEAELGTPSSHAVGKFHGFTNSYTGRIDAVNFTLAHDDGLGSKLVEADLILVGVSRCGKTPTCLYLALQYGLYAANYPLTGEDFERGELPDVVTAHRSKLFGLSISPERLHQIRQERRPNSTYSSLATCQREVHQAEGFFRALNIPFLDSTTMSIEEIASTIVHQSGLRGRT
jgi:regulator of PEP synthase PpsR (kinase-PPPase family)